MQSEELLRAEELRECMFCAAIQLPPNTTIEVKRDAGLLLK